MSSQQDANPRAPHDFGRKLNEEIGEAARRLEAESERVIAYLNDEVVPAIRHGSSRALRTAAEQLSRLAEYMERSRKK